MPQAEFFRHFTQAGHHGFLEDVSFQIIGSLEFLEIGRDSSRLEHRALCLRDLTPDLLAM